MSELAFSALGLLALFLVVVPILTLVCKAALVLRRRFDDDVPTLGSMSSYLLIVGPVLVPAVWFVSGGLHQSEPGWTSKASGVVHLAGQACYNALVLAAGVALLLGFAFVRRHWLQRATMSRVNRAVSCRAQARRIDAICGRHPALARLRDQIIVVEQATEALRTVGLVRPVIEISSEIVAELDDRALLGALLHEAEHLRTCDPLRYLLGSVCLSLNPLAPLMRVELKRWTLAREVICDRAAVQSGAEPLSLAEAIVVAARPHHGARFQPTALLAGGDVRFVRFRIGLLLAYASARHVCGRRQTPFLATAAILLVVTVLLPHALDAWPLAGLHLGIESVLSSLGVG